MPAVQLEQLLCFDLYAASRAVTKAYRPLLEPLGLTYPQYLVMVALWAAAKPLGVKDISDRLSLDSGTLSPLLKRLEAAGLVTRTRSLADEREVKIALTPSGRDLREKIQPVFREIGCLFGLPREDAQALQAKLREISQRMDAGRCGDE